MNNSKTDESSFLALIEDGAGGMSFMNHSTDQSQILREHIKKVADLKVNLEDHKSL